MIKRFSIILGYWACMFCATHTAAHQLKTTETTVLFNQRSEQLEIMHRFYLHDAEHAVKLLFDKQADILDSKTTQQQFAAYVAEEFQLRTLSNLPLKLTQVGHEVDGKFFWVYQETDLPKFLIGLKIYHNALRDLWPSQMNMANIDHNGYIQTLHFTDNKKWLSIKLNP